MRFFLISLLALTVYTSQAQDPLRFRDEVKNLLRSHSSQYQKGDLIVFTGSSSIRMWAGLESEFPPFNVVNHGFGGSHASDLRYYLTPLVINQNPLKVFIYEGDNDISAGKNVDSIVTVMNQIIDLIQLQSPATKIHIISAKPSISRWELREQYVALNKSLKQMCLAQEAVFIDVWTPMLNSNGKIDRSLFISDDLHMNQRGYEIWTKAIAPYVLND